jgi:hypothetical protein
VQQHDRRPVAVDPIADAQTIDLYVGHLPSL